MRYYSVPLMYSNYAEHKRQCTYLVQSHKDVRSSEEADPVCVEQVVSVALYSD